jgi:4-hydroxy-tetrahydrodipicolinate synthase
MSVGGRGVISVVGNIVPRDVIALCKAFDSGNIAEAQKLHRKLFPLCRDMLGLATNPIPIKAAMKILGRDAGELRLPMTPLDAAGETKLRKSLTDYGLI